MKLTEIEIKNFRSIKDITISLDDNCTIFVGKNEAGKSNVLKAIAGGLDENTYEISAKDKRKKGPSESINKDEYYIEYSFILEQDDIDYFIDQFQNEIYDNLFKINNTLVDKKSFIEKYFSKGLYKYDISSQKGWGRYYIPPKTLEINKQIGEIIQETVDEENNSYTTGTLIDINKIKISPTSFKLLSKEDLIKKFSIFLTDYIKENLPETILWEYDEKYLLPSKIDLQTFIDSPNSYIPLKNIFNLAGFKNIKTAFENAIAEDGDYQNLLDNVSTVATQKFAQKWPDLKKVQFIISKDGTDILTKVKEKVSYNFEDRSDGFKQFVSILLMLSTRVETGYIQNALILIDEPDRSLYPTGAKYLKKELIKMSRNNLVFYSTHSPFMIDKSNLERHLIVEKKDDVTTIKKVSHSNFRDDEVLLNAIGTSNFEHMKENNLIFEGWGDNKLFKVALTSTKSGHRNLINFFNDFGITFSTGSKDIKAMTPLIKLADKNVFIFTDSDDASNSAKKAYIDDKGYMYEQWYTFEDLGGNQDQTLEDYIDEKLLKKALKNIGKEDIDLTQNIRGLPIMQFLYNKLDKPQKSEFKNYITNNLDVKFIKESYFVILERLKGKIELLLPSTID